MRELTLLDTGYLAGGLLLCLVMPLLMSFRGSQDERRKGTCLAIVWMGESCLAFAGLGVLLSRSLAGYAAAFGLISYAVCSVVLVHRLNRRLVRPCPGTS